MKGGYWWDDGDTIRLYHGTSSRLVSEIQQNGLKPPPADDWGHCLELLDHYIPRSLWDDELIKKTLGWIDKSQKSQYKGSDLGSGDLCNSFVFATNHFGRAAVYARQNARHSGELDLLIWTSVVLFLCPNIRKLEDFPAVLSPRWPDGEPVVVEFEVPKSDVMIKDMAYPAAYGESIG
jgi:hypothetical protein